MTYLRNGKFTVITMNEGLYNKAKMLQWGKTQVLKDHCAWRFSHADDFFRSHRQVITVTGNGGDVGRE